MIEKILQAKFNMAEEGKTPKFLFANPVYRAFFTMRVEYYVPDDPREFDKIYNLNVFYTPIVKKWKISDSNIIYKYPLENNNMTKREVCPRCRGSGIIEQETSKLANRWQIIYKKRDKVCSRCKGKGEI